MTQKAYPNAVFGCGHLSPIGWCGDCAKEIAERVSWVGVSLEDGESLEEALADLDACERGDEYTETDDE